jgi:hypothetical protein
VGFAPEPPKLAARRVLKYLKGSEYPPNELQLMFSDNLDLGDINALVRTSRALNQLLTPYTCTASPSTYEQKIQTLNTKARAMMLDANLPPNLWAEYS